MLKSIFTLSPVLYVVVPHSTKILFQKLEVIRIVMQHFFCQLTAFVMVELQINQA
jgi:hypothetical protein